MIQSPSDPTPSDKGRPRVERALRPLREFLDTESAGAIVLGVAAVAALAWANSPLSDSYESLWNTRFSVGLGSWDVQQDLRHWVNDGLMTLFFLVVSLEVKRELVHGELSGVRRAALPVVAAIGGMIVPALIYLAINPSGDAAQGWGIPMATDIAFAVGLIALVEPSLPQAAKVFLLSLAIVDDIGAILVIAIFYSFDLDAVSLALAVGAALIMFALRRFGLRWWPVYVLLGITLWLATLESGVHATIAGVAIGFLTPVTPRDGAAPGERIEHLLHPWTSFLIVPLFALANAGLVLDADAIGEAVGSSVAVGTFLGLVIGKPLGICLASLVAVRMGAGALPEGTTMKQIVGLGALAGIGFTVSLFIADLAFAVPELVEQAKIGILSASVVAGIVGAVLLQRQRDRRRKMEA